MNIANRIQAYSARHPVSMNRKIDVYLSENLADLMAEYRIADSSDLGEMDSEFKDLEKRMEDLEGWRSEFQQRLKKDQSRMDRLKTKAGLNK